MATNSTVLVKKSGTKKSATQAVKKSTGDNANIVSAELVHLSNRIFAAQTLDDSKVSMLALKGYINIVCSGESYQSSPFTNYIHYLCDAYLKMSDLTLIKDVFQTLPRFIKNVDDFNQRSYIFTEELSSESPKKRKRSDVETPLKKKREKREKSESLLDKCKPEIHRKLIDVFQLGKPKYLMNTCNAVWKNIKSLHSFDPKTLGLEGFIELMELYVFTKTDIEGLLKDLEIPVTTSNAPKIKKLLENEKVDKSIVFNYRDDTNTSIITEDVDNEDNDGTTNDGTTNDGTNEGTTKKGTNDDEDNDDEKSDDEDRDDEKSDDEKSDDDDYDSVFEFVS
jgi:hypothetical protein